MGRMPQWQTCHINTLGCHKSSRDPHPRCHRVLQREHSILAGVRSPYRVQRKSRLAKPGEALKSRLSYFDGQQAFIPGKITPRVEAIPEHTPSFSRSQGRRGYLSHILRAEQELTKEPHEKGC